jgi:hypothetical protein
VNGGVDAVTSSYMSVCLNQHVPPDVDLVMVCAPMPLTMLQFAVLLTDIWAMYSNLEGVARHR